MGWLKRLYTWVLHWAHTPYGVPALFLLAVAESSFFPIPPDVLLIALAMGRPERSFLFAAACSIGSILGGIIGYLIGWLLWEEVHDVFFRFIMRQELFEHVKALYQTHAFWAVFTAGLTPIPYKVFTIAGGVCHISFVLFLTASAISRSARFFAVAALLYFAGPRIARAIERYFEWLAVAFAVLLIGGFFAVKWLIG